MARGSAGLPDELYDRVVALPGVRRAAPALQIPGNLVGPKGQRGVTLLGADPRFVQLRGNLLKGFSSNRCRPAGHDRGAGAGGEGDRGQHR